MVLSGVYRLERVDFGEILEEILDRKGVATSRFRRGLGVGRFSEMCTLRHRLPAGEDFRYVGFGNYGWPFIHQASSANVPLVCIRLFVSCKHYTSVGVRGNIDEPATSR